MSELLNPSEQAQLEILRRRHSFEREVLQQVDRITTSRRFDRVQQRAKDFLTFVVAKTLLGQAEHIKETVIAIAVFGQSADFDTRESSVVRVAASDLRQRLTDYAGNEGRHDTIEITIPLNTYVPCIRDRRVTVVIAPLDNWHPHGEQAHLCETIACELAYCFHKAGLRAYRDGGEPFAAPAAHYTLRGSVECQDDKLRVNFSLADAHDGRIVSSKVVQGARDDVLKLVREGANALVAALQADRTAA